MINIGKSVKPLAESFKLDGFEFKQLWREGKIALFQKQKAGGVVSYEVVKIQAKPERVMFEHAVPFHEAMPSSETWGTNGWSFCSLDRAKAKFRKLINVSNS